MQSEPEFITILEGPTPDFIPDLQLWNWGLYQGTEESEVALVELRTGNGEDIRQRCRAAWDEGRPVQLDYPDELRMRRQANVVALKLKEVHEGTILKLWVSLPVRESESVFNRDIDDDDDDGSLPF